MIFVFDFDHTLFNTQNFKTGLARSIGISRPVFDKSYKRLINLKYGIIDYDLNKHLKILAKFDKKTISKVNKFLGNIDKFIKPGAFDLLYGLKTKKYKLILLTAGNINWQKRKLVNLKINKYFNKIIFAGFDKTESIKKLKDSTDEIILVNDNFAESKKLKKNLGKNCQVFIIKGIYSKQAENKEFKFFHNLKQLNKFIIKNNL